MKTSLAVLAALALTACVTPSPNAAGTTQISVWEGGCYYAGGCKDESFSLEVDGRFVTESGARALDGAVSTSKHQGAIDPQAFKDAVAVLEAGNFEMMPVRMNGSADDWKPDHPYCMPHGPGVRITRTDAKGASREVFWDTGCRSAAMSAFVSQLKAAMRTGEMAEPPLPAPPMP